MSDDNKENEASEIVHTVWDYFDGPLSGIANFNGKPHYFTAVFVEAIDDYDRGDGGYGLFRLQPIDAQYFRMAMEDWEIWLRWNKAFHSGSALLETHPALPEDRPRHDHLKAAMRDRLEFDLAKSFDARGRFDHPQNSNERWSYEVRWKAPV